MKKLIVIILSVLSLHLWRSRFSEVLIHHYKNDSPLCILICIYYLICTKSLYMLVQYFFLSFFKKKGQCNYKIQLIFCVLNSRVLKFWVKSFLVELLWQRVRERKQKPIEMQADLTLASSHRTHIFVSDQLLTLWTEYWWITW